MELDGFSMVRKAAKLAVYEETMINVKNHQIADIVRVLSALYKIEDKFDLNHYLDWFRISFLLGRNFGTLLEQCSGSKPQWVIYGKLILQFFRFLNTGIRTFPLRRR